MEALFSPFTIPIAAIVGVFACGIVSLIAKNARHVAVRKAEEESRREIAAYIAEGSMSVDEGERLLDAGRSPVPKDD
ncbi:MAG: hypothetical protein AAGI53_07240 [Planctomycetota bacterium]